MKRQISAIVLAGGQGRRMGFIDKGLLEFQGKPLIAHVLARIEPQVTDLVISCNNNFEHYKQYGYPTISDTQSDLAGPLAGILSCYPAIKNPLCFIVPCDMPFLPLDLVEQLALHKSINRPISITGDGKLQPLLSLVDTDMIPGIEVLLAKGIHAARQWLKDSDGTILEYEYEGTELFRNINTASDL